jgi:hypothetical protein
VTNNLRKPLILKLSRNRDGAVDQFCEKIASSEKSVGHRYAPRDALKLGSRSPRTRFGERGFSFFLFVASCLSNQFALSGKRTALA